MKLKHKKTGEVCSSGEFNIHTCCPQEIYVYYKDWYDTDFMHDYDVWLESKNEWKDILEAFRDYDLITDNYNTYFFEPKTQEDRIRGFTLD